MKPNYGNWVPKRLLYVLLVAALVFFALLIWALADGWAWPWMVLAAILLVASTGFLCYMAVLYHVFSFSGGGLMGRVHEYVAKRLPWDGQGRLLDALLDVLADAECFCYFHDSNGVYEVTFLSHDELAGDGLVAALDGHEVGAAREVAA